jgi:hypothetical protein
MWSELARLEHSDQQGTTQIAGPETRSPFERAQPRSNKNVVFAPFSIPIWCLNTVHPDRFFHSRCSEALAKGKSFGWLLVTILFLYSYSESK